MNKNYSIQEIINGCLKKQPIYQRAMVDQYAGLLSVLCKRYLKDHDLAKDLVQDSLIKIFKNLEKFDPFKGSFESWISTIAIRLCLSKLKSKEMRVVSLDLKEYEEVKDESSTFVLDQLQTDHLVQLIKGLPKDFRTVFNMSAIDGFKHQEIAEHLGISIELSRARLSRAKGMLRSKINNINNQELWVNTI